MPDQRPFGYALDLSHAMCGRYTLTTPGDLVADLFALEEIPVLTARFNISPTQEAPAIRVGEDGRRHLDFLRWGLVPAWAKDAAIGNRMINARGETVAEKPAYRGPLKWQRCLVVADGFYEWQATGGRKQPYYFRHVDGRPFAFAGLWDRWQPATADALESFTILTTEPNRVVSPVHRRMPVILSPAAFDTWLDRGQTDGRELAKLAVPSPSEELTGFPVSTWVNSPGNDGPRCVEPVALADS